MPGGRPVSPPRTERGRAILARIREEGLTITEAAARAGVNFDTLHAAIHKPNLDLMSLRAVERICTRLGVPLSVLSPVLARHAG